MMDVIIPVGDMPVTAQVTTPGKAIVAAQISAAGTEAALQAADRADAAASNADAAAKRANAAADSLLFEVKPYKDGYALYQIIG